MSDVRIVDLARAPDFNLGRMRVLPTRRQLVSGSGEGATVQPRVMQVLVALARADGEIVTRDELTQSCWHGRIVGEDAINRVISQLHRLSAGIGAGSFNIETITKVGYRLHAGAAERPAKIAAVPSVGPEASAKPASRRLLLGLGAGALAAAAIGGGLWWRSWKDQPPSPKAAAMLEQAMVALQQGTREGQYQAIGLMQKVVADYPSYADGWGGLGYAYALAGHWRPETIAGPMRDRASHAAARARALDPDNAYAEVTAAMIPPSRGSWLGVERALRAAFKRHPNTYQLFYALGGVLCQVGRNADAAAIFATVRRHTTPTPPCVYYEEIMALWGANRLEETDRIIDEALNIYPTQFAIWFSRVYTYMYSGRAQAAIGLLEDASTRPSGIPSGEFDRVLQVAKVLLSREPAAIDQIMQVEVARAKRGAGYAENTMQFASALGRLDTAFTVAEAYYFGAGFAVPEVRFTPEQGSYTPIGERQAAILFYPSTARMRSHPRFNSLTQRLGLVDYWRASGSRPDDI